MKHDPASIEPSRLRPVAAVGPAVVRIGSMRARIAAALPDCGQIAAYLHTADGKLVFSRYLPVVGRRTVTFDFGDLPPAVYYCRVAVVGTAFTARFAVVK